MLDERYVVDRHRCHRAVKFGVSVDEDRGKISTFNW